MPEGSLRGVVQGVAYVVVDIEVQLEGKTQIIIETHHVWPLVRGQIQQRPVEGRTEEGAVGPAGNLEAPEVAGCRADQLIVQLHDGGVGLRAGPLPQASALVSVVPELALDDAPRAVGKGPMAARGEDRSRILEDWICGGGGRRSKARE